MSFSTQRTPSLQIQAAPRFQLTPAKKMLRKFPEGFKFGVATSAYQIEGAWNEDGKGESVWDFYTHTFPERIDDRSNADIACDSYHQLDEDIANLKRLNVAFYRFSIAWTRIMPTGMPNIINAAGIAYYNELIDKLVAAGVEPMVTIYHWDMPLKLQELGGWANPRIADFFVAYARFCFATFGDRVRTWITINEPFQIAEYGYSNTVFAPFYDFKGIGCYLAGHTLLQAHGRAYRLYEREFKPTQGGRVGIVNECGWTEPNTSSPEDIEAAERYRQMYYGWFAHPIWSKTGDYPPVMRARIDALSREQGFETSRLPEFTPEEVEMLRGAADFMGFNHYTSYRARNNPLGHVPSVEHDRGVETFADEAWPKAAIYGFRVVPWGLQNILRWIKIEYGNPEVMILENGFAGPKDESLNDFARIDYFKGYINAVLNAILDDKCNITAYTAWSLMDNYEWSGGYTTRFGLFHVDFNDSQRKRTPKRSAYYFQQLIRTGMLLDEVPNDFIRH